MKRFSSKLNKYTVSFVYILVIKNITIYLFCHFIDYFSYTFKTYCVSLTLYPQTGCFILALYWEPPSFCVAEHGGRGEATIDVGVNRGHICWICYKGFSRAWCLHRHISDTHYLPEKRFDCVDCGRTYRSRNSLVSHRCQYHAKPKQNEHNEFEHVFWLVWIWKKWLYYIIEHILYLW